MIMRPRFGPTGRALRIHDDLYFRMHDGVQSDGVQSDGVQSDGADAWQLGPRVFDLRSCPE